VDYGDDIIGLGLNIRGHGNSQSNLKPGFPATFSISCTTRRCISTAVPIWTAHGHWISSLPDPKWTKNA
ncbi:MAG TPA: hypothetical protein PK855_05210, partial [Bacteroidales bacterium]|nr:hypothetical protein [Bacteroidales bacterium]